jgi:hypothetical protein
MLRAAPEPRRAASSRGITHFPKHDLAVIVSSNVRNRPEPVPEGKTGDELCLASSIMSSSGSAAFGILLIALFTVGCGEPCERVIKVRKVVNMKGDAKVEVQTAARVGELAWKFNRGIWEAASGNEKVFPADEVAVRAIEDCRGVKR